MKFWNNHQLYLGLLVGIVACPIPATASPDWRKLNKIISTGDWNQVEAMLEGYPRDAFLASEGSVLEILKHGDLNLIQLMIKKGLDINKAVHSGRSELLSPLAELGEEYKSTHPPIKQKYLNTIKLLIKQGADVNRGDFLSTIFEDDDPEFFQFLLDNHLDLNFKYSYDPESQPTPLFCSLGPRSLNLLLKESASKNIPIDINQPFNNFNNTLLHVTNDPEIIDLLLTAGADVNRLNKAGWSAIDMIIMKGDKKLLEPLVRHNKLDKDFLDDPEKSDIVMSIFNQNSVNLKLDCEDSRHPKWKLTTQKLDKLIEEGFLNRVERMKIFNCDMHSLPQNLNKLKNLRSLTVNKSNLKDISAITSLSSIEELDFHDNKIESYPSNVVHLPHLQILHLSSNPVREITPALMKSLRETISDFSIDQAPATTENALFATNTEKTREMARLLNPSNPSYGVNIDVAIRDPNADLQFFVKTPGKDVEKILRKIVEDPSYRIFEGTIVNGKPYKPACKLLALKLLAKHREKQSLMYLQGSNTQIGAALAGQSLEDKSRENLHRLDLLLGTMNQDELQIYNLFLNKKFYLKHYTQADRYQNIKDSDSELKSFKSLMAEGKLRGKSNNTQAKDRNLGNTNNVFFRLETSPQNDSTSRFGKSVVVMDQDQLYKNGAIYLWDLLKGPAERAQEYKNSKTDKVVRIVEQPKDYTKDPVTIRYNSSGLAAADPNVSTTSQTFKFTDTFFYKDDIKPGIAKFLIFELRNMGLTEEALKDPTLLDSIYRKLYSIQAMLPNEVKLNPTNHTFSE